MARPYAAVALALALALLVAAAPSPAAAAKRATCPPIGFDSLPNFDIKAFVGASPWYSIQQNEVFYQPKSALYCVRAVYVPRDASDLSKGVNVYNTANLGSVTGPQQGSTAGGAFGLLAFPDSVAAAKNPATGASKLRVLPAALEIKFKIAPSSPLISGPYWIVASSGDLSQPDAWAVISGGPPKTSSNGKCRVGRAGLQTPLDVNSSGTWIFARNPSPPQATIDAARAAMTTLGYDLSTLLPVVQAACTYPAVPK